MPNNTEAGKLIAYTMTERGERTSCLLDFAVGSDPTSRAAAVAAIAGGALDATPAQDGARS